MPRQEKEAHFYVGVRHPQMAAAVVAGDSRLREVQGGEEEDPMDDEGLDDSEEDWQPEDSDESSMSPGLPVARSNSSGQYRM